MKRFLKETIQYGVLSLLLAIVLSLLLYTTSDDFMFLFGRQSEVSKYMYLQEHAHEYNTFIFGSSFTHRGVDPRVLEIVSDGAVQAFNMATEGQPFETTYFFIKESMPYIPEGSRVVVEMRNPQVSEFPDRNYRTPMGLHTMTPRTIYEAFIFLDAIENRSGAPKDEERLGVVKIAFYKYIGTGIFDYLQKKLIFSRLDNMQNEKVLQQNRGFTYPFSETEERHKMFVADVENNNAKDFYNQMRNISQTYEREKEDQNIPPHLVEKTVERWITLFNDLEERNIEAVFYLKPRSRYVAYLMLQKRYLEAAGFRVFDLADPDMYPEFFIPEYSYDEGHLNQEGAKHFTKVLYKVVWNQ